MFLRVLLIVFVVSVACRQDRKIKTVINPECDKCTDDETLFYIRADGPNDTMHIMWDFTSGVPTFLYVLSDLNSTADFKWEDAKLIDVNLNGTTKYGLANWIYRLFEYNDTDDLGYMTPKSPYHSFSLEHMHWRRVNIVDNGNEVSLKMYGHLKHNKGTIAVKLQYLPFTDYATELPHLIHTANSTLVDVSLVNMTTSRDFNSSRFALNVVLMATDIQQQEDLHFITRKSLDDEHTPGVFEIIEIKTPMSYSGHDGGYMQFRPVGYTDPKREVSSSTNVHLSSFNVTGTKDMITMVQTMGAFRKYKFPMLGLQTTVSFGLSGDGFYEKHNYTAWSYTTGYGTPPVEGFSLFVIIIISIGLGVPVLLALSGIIYVIVRRYKQRNLPQRFTDEE